MKDENIYADILRFVDRVNDKLRRVRSLVEVEFDVPIFNGCVLIPTSRDKRNDDVLQRTVPSGCHRSGNST